MALRTMFVALVALETRHVGEVCVHDLTFLLYTGVVCGMLVNDLQVSSYLTLSWCVGPGAAVAAF